MRSRLAVLVVLYACLSTQGCSMARESTPAQSDPPEALPSMVQQPEPPEPEPAPESLDSKSPQTEPPSASEAEEYGVRQWFFRCHPHVAARVAFKPGEVTLDESDSTRAELRAMVERWAARPPDERPDALWVNGGNDPDEPPATAFDRAHAVVALLEDFGLADVQVVVDAGGIDEDHRSTHARWVIVWVVYPLDCLL